jgi:hypothetical protein
MVFDFLQPVSVSVEQFILKLSNQTLGKKVGAKMKEVAEAILLFDQNKIAELEQNGKSNLLIGTIQTHPRCRIDLFQRPFATVPYLGRGSVDPILEAQIQQGEQIVNKKSISNLSEKSYVTYHSTPLLPAIKEQIMNPANCVEGVASEGWIRGGVPSRELTRDADYFNKHTSYQYV